MRRESLRKTGKGGGEVTCVYVCVNQFEVIKFVDSRFEYY